MFDSYSMALPLFPISKQLLARTVRSVFRRFLKVHTFRRWLAQVFPDCSRLLQLWFQDRMCPTSRFRFRRRMARRAVPLLTKILPESPFRVSAVGVEKPQTNPLPSRN